MPPGSTMATIAERGRLGRRRWAIFAAAGDRRHRRTGWHGARRAWAPDRTVGLAERGSSSITAVSGAKALSAMPRIDRCQERVLVDRVVDRAPNPHVVEGRLGRIEEPDPWRAGPGGFSIADGGDLLEAGQRLGRDEIDALRLAALERGHTGARLRDELPDDAVEVRGAGPVTPRRLPRVGRVPDHRRVVLGDVLLDHERPGADRPGVDLVARLPHRLGRDKASAPPRRR